MEAAKVDVTLSGIMASRIRQWPHVVWAEAEPESSNTRAHAVRSFVMSPTLR
jgi:hypothetical protein